MTDCQLRRIGARPQIFGYLDLMLAIDHLIEEWQAGDEAHHRDEPWRAGMRAYEAVDTVEVIYTGSILDVDALRILMPLTEPHKGFARPGIVVVHRDLDYPGLQNRGAALR